MARNRKSPKIKLGIIFGIVLTALLIGGVFFVKVAFEITKINISGSDKYSYEQLYDYIFKDRNDKNLLLFQYTNGKAPEPDIPFISKVVIEVKWPHTLDVHVYEKKVVGYVEYKGCNMYFDKDGVVVESSQEIFDKVPKVTGLEYTNIVLYSQLGVSDLMVFKSIHNLVQNLDKYEITVDEIQVNEDGSMNMKMDKVLVKLGVQDDYLGDKIYELSCMLTDLDGMDGTLYMDEYTGDSSYITFKKNE